MALTPGTRIGLYEILSALGAGGMGEVYRATDTKLKRQVAIKILPPSVAADPDRLARFQREAEVLASLNHPHIAAIYGLEDADGVKALVMELVEGPTLADLIAQGPVPIDETLPIARQIADALEAAHEQGIIHRDLKPANIKVRPDATVKVLDFGLAKAMDPVGRAPDVSQSPTITTPAMTQAGMILGTAAYMSPEQAKGRPTDKRSDIWAFGCVLYEMLTGKQAFDGEDATDVIASIVKSDPAWNLLPKTTPANIRFLLERCLEKDPKRRLHDMADFRILLDAPPAAAVAPARLRARRRSVLQTIAAATAAATLAGLAVWMLRPEPTRSVRRFPVTLAASVRFSPPGGHLVALSADGNHLVYAANQRLYLRRMDQLEAEPIRGTEGGSSNPFFSPDGQWIGFWQGGQLKKVAVTGGAPVTLCKAENPTGASWGTDDVIVFGQGSQGIWQILGSGGQPSVLIKLDAPKGETVAHGPQMLPGGEAVLFTLRRRETTSWDDAQIVIQMLSTGERRVVVEGGRDARYLPTGHLVYARDGVLLAIPFDLGRMAVMGGPVPVVEGVAAANPTGRVEGGAGTAHFTISRNGSLAYVTGGPVTAARTLVWVDRQGREEPIAVPLRNYIIPRLSPDGTRIALDVRDQATDIWVWDLARQTLTRLNLDPARDVYPAWTPDGRRLAFGSARGGGGVDNLYWQPADGTGQVERLKESTNPEVPYAFSPDGKYLLFRETGPKTGFDVYMLSLDGARRATALMHTQFSEQNAEVSPDGRWLAYQSDESGQNEVYVRPFPNVDGGRWLMSTGGGTRPLWARTSRELFYLTTGGSNVRMMAVPFQPGTSFAAGTPQTLFEGGYFAGSEGRTYDVSPDGQRFLMIKNAGTAAEAAPQIIVVENWFEELKRLVPTN